MNLLERESMISAGLVQPATSRERYLAIDSSIRATVSEHQWQWMTDEQKANIERDQLEPEF